MPQILHPLNFQDGVKCPPAQEARFPFYSTPQKSLVGDGFVAILPADMQAMLRQNHLRPRELELNLRAEHLKWCRGGERSGVFQSCQGKEWSKGISSNFITINISRNLIIIIVIIIIKLRVFNLENVRLFRD